MKEREVNMSAIDWLRILYGFRYCLRWSIAMVMVMFATKPHEKSSQQSTQSEPLIHSAGPP
jgi:hypothetical protein